MHVLRRQRADWDRIHHGSVLPQLGDSCIEHPKREAIGRIKGWQCLDNEPDRYKHIARTLTG